MWTLCGDCSTPPFFFKKQTSTLKIQNKQRVMPSNLSLPSHRPAAHTCATRMPQMAWCPTLGGRHLSAEACLPQQSEQSVAISICSTTGRYQREGCHHTPHTRSYSCLPIHLILASFQQPIYLFFSSLSISPRFVPFIPLHNTVFYPFKY